ncbi:conserved exported hypothetical protein [Bradyrhizobium sp. ORS 375]|uniref:DUF3124 domain-containing protein n=1 Tax=Bradyrhizobium sp. (strain ORS 375) TaxID=566679 RepID=UPI000240AD8A|nr:DUF3124 domain-containing protein [Bradyrhizobium sp. ORS 375]CCD94100.1 conserved exported hypothetical protein [Bradyrhizobium sp. ORS 375]
MSRRRTRKPAICHIAAAAVGLLLASAEMRAADSVTTSFASSLTAVPAETPTVAGAVYVPVYSSVTMAPGRVQADFSVTLSIHNASEQRPLILRRINYYDTAGALVEAHLSAPVALKPFATIEIFVPTKDTRGGTGANFVIDWAATGEIAEPVVEALMVGGIGAGHYAFISQGRPIRSSGGRP